MSPTRRNRILQSLSELLRVALKFKSPRHRAQQHVSEGQSLDVAMDDSELIPDHNRDQEYEASQLRAHKSHNERQLISQLPNELLYQIFLKGIPPRHAATYPALLRKYCDTKRHLGQVCHLWREIALECPDMWCNAVDLSAGIWWIVEVLRRSRDRPVTAFMPRGTKEECFALVVQTQKIRGLFANVQRPYLAKRVLDHLRDLRCLEELDFVCSESRSGLSEALGSWTRDASTTLSSALRCLYLSGPSIPLPTHRMQTLICLYVAHSWGSKTSSEWLIALRNFPNLQELSLINCIQPDFFTIQTSGAEDVHLPLPSNLTHLPHLRELELTGNHIRCGTVFRGLVIPSGCVLRMSTHDTAVGPSLNAVVQFLQSDQQLCRACPPSQNRSLCFKATSTQLYLQVSEEGVVKLDLHLKFDDNYCRELDAAAPTVAALLSATLLRFRRRGGFSALNISLEKLLAASPRFSQWLCQVQGPLLTPQEIHTLRLQETPTVYELLNLVENEIAPHFGKTNTATDDNPESIPLTPYPRLQYITFNHVDFNKQEGGFILERITSFISRHPNVRVTRLTQCKHTEGVADKIRALGVEVAVD